MTKAKKPSPKPAKPAQTSEVKVGPLTLALIKARALIVPFKQHTRGANARGRDGLAISPTSPEAFCFCAVGALMRVAGIGDMEPENKLYKEMHALLNAAAKEMWGPGAADRAVANVNDSSGHAAVIKMYNRAIVLAKGR